MLPLLRFVAAISITAASPDKANSQISIDGVASFIQRTARVSNTEFSVHPGTGFPPTSHEAGAGVPVEPQNDTDVAPNDQSYPSTLVELEAMGYRLAAHLGRNVILLKPNGGDLTSVGPLKDKDIWNASDAWVNFTFWHPAGVISNVNGGRVVWANVNFINIVALCELSILAYPFAIIPLALFGAIAVGLCLVKVDIPSDATLGPGPPAVPTSQLTLRSQRIYNAWCTFCCTIPSLLVFGVPLALIYMSYALPQEVYVILLITSSAFVFSNGVHMALFSPFVLHRIMQNNRKDASDVLGELKADQKQEIVHWVIFPNYQEDVDIIESSVRSVACSSLAYSNICILLAMEEREGPQAKKKTEHLRQRFEGRFKDFFETYHPANLPNDPPGKASNVAYAFNRLTERLQASGQDPSKVMLTIADADSEFHAVHFETLTRQYFETEPQHRGTTLWQSAILHVKNYHRQPGPVLVGTMFTCMAELSFLADPNAIRFPYSTYSLSFDLAHKVGGWDAEWIAEDWHMGIKCFLFTLGRSKVQPVALPTLNYSPEAETWMGTCHARFVQAKRHALGFSDLSYYFMMLPLIFLHLTKVKRDDGANLADFWQLFFGGLAHVVRLVNTHVILGILTLYAVFDMVLKQLMLAMMGHARGIEGLFQRTFFATTMFGVASILMMSIVTITFQVIYHILEERLEKPKPKWSWIYRGHFIHWCMTALSFLFCGPIFFLALAYSVWIAALKMLSSRSFTYEVASKPTKEQRST